MFQNSEINVPVSTIYQAVHSVILIIVTHFSRILLLSKQYDMGWLFGIINFLICVLSTLK